MAKLYEANFDIDWVRGKVGEDLLETFLGELNEGAKFEVKTDYRANETGNLYIETWQYRSDDESDKKVSGINITTADYWCFASPSGDGFVMIKTDKLKELIRETNPKETRQPIANGKTNASIGRLVPVKDVIKKIGL